MEPIIKPLIISGIFLNSEKIPLLLDFLTTADLCRTSMMAFLGKVSATVYVLPFPIINKGWGGEASSEWGWLFKWTLWIKRSERDSLITASPIWKTTHYNQKLPKNMWRLTDIRILKVHLFFTLKKSQVNVQKAKWNKSYTIQNSWILSWVPR